MSGRSNALTTLVLDLIDFDIPLSPLESVYHFAARKRKQKLAKKRYLEALWHLQKQGNVKVISKAGERFITLTHKGQLEKLLRLAGVQKTARWDGKWRILMFDIPESCHTDRDSFRRLLKKNNFAILQGSVFVSPYPLNREAVKYLEGSGLMQYIRIMKVEEMDNDADLKKQFGLINARPRIN